VNDIVVICGLGFGDEGKGAITDFLSREYGASTVIRYNGGPQAGHNVITPDGRWHCFAQFGSGMFTPSVNTYLSKDMLIEPEALATEAGILSAKGVNNVYDRLVIDTQCTIITPMHKMLGRIKEIARGRKAHGSCGMGVGQTIFWKEDGFSLSVSDVLEGKAYQVLSELKEYAFSRVSSIVPQHSSEEIEETIRYFRKRCHPQKLASCYSYLLSSLGFSFDVSRKHLGHIFQNDTVIIFEGAQGALLDRTRGFSPYVTKSNATWGNARDLIEHANVDGLERVKKVGIMRAYGHRHGAGPFVTEDTSLKDFFDDPLNFENRWQGAFRVGWLDLLALRYGIAINDGVDEIALTSLDRLSGLDPIRVCSSYEYRGDFRDLDQHFEWEPLAEGRARITAIRHIASPLRWAVGDGLAHHLFQCRPLEWVEFPGWKEHIGDMQNISDLPVNARTLLEFLESPQGFNTIISLVSVGPASHQKIRAHI